MEDENVYFNDAASHTNFKTPVLDWLPAAFPSQSSKLTPRRQERLSNYGPTELRNNRPKPGE
jgi:hypothetical protein